MKIDWQAYLDNSLSTEERERAEHLLKTDSGSVRELEGLKSFVSTLRSAALSEEIPMDRLAALLPREETKRTGFSWPRVGWVTGLAAAAVLAFVFLRPQVETSDGYDLFTSDPVVASNWASKNLDMTIPALDLGSDAPIFYVHKSGDRCCFDYKVDGKTYHLNVQAKVNGKQPRGTPIQLSNGQPAFRGGGIRWSQGNYSMYLVGPDDEKALDLANRASKLISQRA